MSTVKELQLTIPHDARSVNLSIGYGDHCIHQYIDLAGAEKITLVRAPKPKAPLPKWHKKFNDPSETEQALRGAAEAIDHRAFWEETEEGHEYWSDVKSKLESMADEMAAYIRDSK
jgi:hypothetical protein